MPSKKPLQPYHAKRDFRRSPEPEGARRPRSRRPRFVIHKHDASSLHYDVRLEAGGVLRSWAVPKGPSTDPRDKRLAMPTEDHPLEYADVEGVILEGEYGAGTVQDRQGNERWLLVKMDDEGADRRRDPVSSQPASVLTGRTNEDLAEQA